MFLAGVGALILLLSYGRHGNLVYRRAPGALPWKEIWRLDWILQPELPYWSAYMKILVLAVLGILLMVVAVLLLVRSLRR
jgi:hypothetical protein